MPDRPRTLLAWLLTVLLVAGLALVAVPGASAAGAPSRPLRYVALGDSFSAGSGVLPLSPTAPPACARSAANYPATVARYVGARLVDVTCGAAETRHLSTAQYPGVAPQLDALGPRTDLVTLTMGGNDNAVFVGAIAACGSAGLAALGQGSLCRTLYGDRFDELVETRTYPAVRRALRQVHRAAPHARVAILGYPWIVPAEPDPACFPQLPVATGDLGYLRSLQAHLNRVIRRAARETGTTFVSMAKASEGHDACGTVDTRWVEPALLTSQLVPVHPNAAGEDAMADRVLHRLHLLAP